MSSLGYGFIQQLPNTPFPEAVRRVTEALQGQGFGVLTEIDVRDTLARKLGADFRHYVILGACNPQLAQQGLEAEPHLGLLLPCNVVVQERDGGGSTVSVLDPAVMARVVDNPDLAPMVEDATTRLRTALASLA
jgi:uncharacterized protein (DUF302 family)